MKLISPYRQGPFKQYKGNLHTHTTNSDGLLPPQKAVDLYAGLGYHFLMLSDHDLVTDTRVLDPHGMTLIPGYEITAEGSHILHVKADRPLPIDADRQVMLDAINAANGLAIMNHPNWGEDFTHCEQAELEALDGYLGIEIYNGVSERAEGTALATERWDMLLSRGRRVWGFGNDDTHLAEDSGITWNMVFAEDAAEASLLESMRLGNFYVSTGIVIDSIRAEGNRIEIESHGTQCFRVVRDHGMILATVEGPVLRFEAPDVWPLSYLRVECYGAGTRMAWTQPFFADGA